jgi:uncharacterized protein involved in tolerance to divalent cations
MQINTSSTLLAKVEALIIDGHPYELPDILTLNVYGYYTNYLQWVNAQGLQ